MKNNKTKIIFLQVIASAILITLSFSCKKDKTEPEQATVTSSPAPSFVPEVSAKVNGQVWTQGKYGAVMSKSMGTYMFSGQSKSTNPYSSISVTLKQQTGIIDFSTVQSWNCQMRYKNEDGTIFTAKSGTINVNQFDTTNSNIAKRFIAQFSFKTDTINGESYEITEGVMDFKE